MNHALRQSMVFLDVPMMQQPQACLGNAAKLLVDGGEPAGDDTEKCFRTGIDA